MPTSKLNHFFPMRALLLSLAACLPLLLNACSAGNTCKADSECTSGSICSSGTCKKTCTATTDCKAGQDCRLGASSDAQTTCNAVSYAQPASGGFGTDCALFACGQGTTPCAAGFACRAGASCDAYAVCSTTCKADADCPSEYYCSATADLADIDRLNTGAASCTASSDCPADAFCASTYDASNNVIHVCQKKMCAPRGRCSECAIDAQCRGTSLQATYLCAHDNIGGRFCARPCNSDSDCLKPIKIQGASGATITYGPFETCQSDSSGASVCTPITGACHGKSSVSSVSGDGQVCSPCRPGLIPGDCSEGNVCLDPTGSGESFCTKGCTVRADKQPNGSYAPSEDTCPTGTYCRASIPQSCGNSCVGQGICTADKYYAAYTCGASPASF